ncbi:hypothetical protein BJY52DRAFT_763319 [Lactarius psammicola]|nr:hypothetical protein BJY52DRAFT_763319 [Lactarius psammicola]
MRRCLSVYRPPSPASYWGKVVLMITGASRGISLETAIYHARAGASLAIVGRKQETLDAGKDAILREQPSAQVVMFPADVCVVKKAEEAVTSTMANFGRLDTLRTNAGTLRPMNELEIRRDGGRCSRSTFVELTTSSSACAHLRAVPGRRHLFPLSTHGSRPCCGNDPLSHLRKGRFLSGRYVIATWDQGEVKRDWKDKIFTEDLLK